jgi:hypothetical protein
MTDKVEDEAPKEDVVDSKVLDSEEGGESGEQVAVLAPEEEKAQSFGWMPKEDWVKAGKTEEEWVPAKHFLKFGELKQQVISKEKMLTKQEKIIKKMKDHHLNVRERAMADAMSQLKRERAAALEEGDIIAAEKIRDRIDYTKEQFQKTPLLPKDIEDELQSNTINDPPAEFYEFSSRNPWYEADPKRQDEISQEADALGYAFVQKSNLNGRTVTANDVYEHVEKQIKKLYPEKFGTPKSPQSDTPSRSSGSSSSESKLSSEEIAIAKSFGLTEKQYLAELKAYKGR